MQNKVTISEFLEFVNKSEKRERVFVRAGIVDKGQPIMWMPEELKALYLIIKRHGYNSTRTITNRVNKKINENPTGDLQAVLDL